MVVVVLQHMRSCKARAVLVVPDDRQLWFPLLAAATVRSVSVAAKWDAGTFFHMHPRFDSVWSRLSCDHGWILSGSVNVRLITNKQNKPTIRRRKRRLFSSSGAGKPWKWTVGRNESMTTNRFLLVDREVHHCTASIYARPGSHTQPRSCPHLARQAIGHLLRLTCIILPVVQSLLSSHRAGQLPLTAAPVLIRVAEARGRVLCPGRHGENYDIFYFCQ